LNISDNLVKVLETIEMAASRSGRRSDAIRLVAVSKNMPLSDIEAAMCAGLLHFGENRPQELRDKLAAKLPVKWHMIGQLQINKIKYVAGKVDLLQSVDRFPLMDALQAYCLKHDIQQSVLLQVNLGEESQKSGFMPNEVAAAIVKASECPNLKIRGFMAVAPIVLNPEAIRPLFRQMRNLFDSVAREGMDTLSMGMTDDYPIAIEEGATLIRVGRALFGSRLS